MTARRALWLCALALGGTTPGCGESQAGGVAPGAAGPAIGGGSGGMNAAGGGLGSSSNAAGSSGTVSMAGVAGAAPNDPVASSARPLAIVVDAAGSGCASYYPEILRAEGISSFELLPLEDLSQLSDYSAAILPGAALSAEQASAIASWVEQGGRLISLRPDPKLAQLLGISAAQGVAREGYFQVDAARWGGASVPLQFHGEASLHAPLPGTRVEGALLDEGRASLEFPALTLREGIGVQGGKAAFVAFDLACSVISTRQGNPALAGRTDLDPLPRSSELFAGFLDTESFEIPQADEQQRLLVRLLQTIAADRAPLPRFWYLPGGRKLAVVMTGDDHNSNGTVAFFDALRGPSYSPAGCSAEKWTCARATSWVYSNVTALKNGAASALVAEGFELGPHLAMDRDGGCAVWSSEGDLLARFSARLSEFELDYGIAPATTNRSHCFVFADWDSQPKVEAQLGIRLDENYTPYALPGTKNRLGRLNGSAMPMRFTDESGSVIDVYQLVSDMDYEYFDAGTSSATMAAAIGKLFDGALGSNEWVGFVGTHYDYSGGLEASFRAALLGEIAKRQADSVAMISARQLLDWLDLRNASSFHELGFDGTSLSFDLRLASGLPNPGLEAMLPSEVAGKRLASIERAGAAVPPLRTSTFRGVAYTFFEAVSGQHVARYE